ncbi:MAG: FIG00453616: hypothetical protein [uncultured Caballeronia sp.]|nr:MAG: FIG00453616: hypothetical protein [uncultured Caballeronia sp.]
MTDSTASGAHGFEHGTFDEWPLELRKLFDGTSIKTKTGFTASLLAADEGRVQTSLLSVGELFAPDRGTLCFSLWPQSRAARLVSKTGRATLTFVFNEAFFQVQLQARIAPLEGTSVTCFIATIESGEWQKVPYARLAQGIGFEFAQGHGDAVLARWRKQIDVLKRAASAAA